MYIEKQNLLVKKVQGKKISVSLRGNSDIELCEKISKKEVLFWKQQTSYQNFESQLYDTNILEEVVYMSCYIQNMMFFDSKLAQRYKDQISKFPQRFIYESNKTEGSRISFEQLQLIFADKKSSHDNLGEIQEVKNSILLWEYLQSEFLFNITHIKKVYHKLTKDMLMDTGKPYPRGFRRVDVVVNNAQTSHIENIQDDIQGLLSWYHEHKKDIFPLQLAFDFHLRFEEIHPFRDGNGRTGRMLMNKIFLANKFIPHIIFSENRRAYFSSIASASEGRKKKYYKFMLEQYKKTLNTII